ncbi:glycosyltransferase [Alsobacter sp. KACC 23698]|uniref:Glycosyltransferase n=1 Tax=Alsobacter sp. KACC 23698 TaxID=3149229 RepID=A0AAU7JAD4_9HYPH
MKVSIVHDWFFEIAGSEKVVKQMLEIWPQAKLHAQFCKLDAAQIAQLGLPPVETTWLQHAPGIARFPSLYVPFMPLSIETLDVSSADVVISSHHTAAKGVLTSPEQLHLCYCYSPLRAAWDLREEYLSKVPAPLRPLGRYALHRLRRSEVQASFGVDHFIAISRFVAQRISKYYRREATIIHPPAELDAYSVGAEKDDFFLCLGRLVRYKQAGMIVEAFRRMPNRRLVVIGEGEDAALLSRLAEGCPNIQLMGRQPDDVVKDHLQRARALVLASIEDFGLTTVEAQACGTPVIGYDRGGIRDIIVDPAHGLLYAQRGPAEIQQAVERFVEIESTFSAQACAENAQRFSKDRFAERLRGVLDQQLDLTRERLN